jgi:hypothetical protein
VRQGVDAAARVLADTGYEIDEADPPMVDEAVGLWSTLVLTDARLLLSVLRSAFGATPCGSSTALSNSGPSSTGSATRRG